MRVHGIICSYFGDGELDLGKTSRWLQWFTDSLFFYDANYQSQARQYAVDYAKSWPDAQFAYHSGLSYFTDTRYMRMGAFQAADKAWSYGPNDWVIFVDGTESISTDVPHDQLELLSPDSTKFRYLYDEVAGAAGNSLTMPMRIFLNQGTVVEQDYPIDPTLPMDPTNTAVFWSCQPHYLGSLVAPWRYMTRMIKVSTLRTWTLANFAILDQYQASGTTGHVSLISYAYARYSEVNYHNPSLWVQANDEGFANRLLIQQIPSRNIPELPIVYATPDPPGYSPTVPPGPARITVVPDSMDTQLFNFTGNVTNESGNETYSWTFGDTTTGTGQTVSHEFPGVGPYTVSVSVADPDVGPPPRTASVVITPNSLESIQPQPPPAPSDPATRMLSAPYCYYINQARGIYVMLFTALWRKNPRDGAWYQQLDVGTIPLDPITGQPNIGVDVNGNPIDPAYWDQQQPQPRVVATTGNQMGPGT